MRKFDKAAVVLGVAGTWVYMAGVDQDRLLQALSGIMVALCGAGVHKIGEVLEEKREAEEERNAQIKDEVFAVWLRNPLK